VRGGDGLRKAYAMDIAGKEAVRAALGQNGLSLLEDDDDDDGLGDVGKWGIMEEIQTDGSDESTTTYYPTIPLAIQYSNWSPGQTFSFTIRNLTAQLPNE